MLIFDNFESMEKATAFAEYVEGATAYPERRDDIDPFPFELVGPVVYAERGDELAERDIIAAVADFGGVFAGT